MVRATRGGRRRRRLGARTAVAVAVTAATGTCAALIWNSSDAAFTTTTATTANTFTTGTVTLSDSSPGVAIFPAGGPSLKPGTTGTACLTVTYSGTLVGAALVPVKLFVSQWMDLGSGGNQLSPDLLWSVESGTGATGTGTTCPSTGMTWSTLYPTTGAPSPLPGTSKVTAGAKTLHDFTYTPFTSYANGLATGWTPASTGETRVFRFTYRLADDASDTAQGSTCTARFTWEVRSS